jgi:hypothetical protein
MQKKLVLSVTLAILFVCGTPLQMQAGVTKVIKKTTGAFLGAVALGTVVDLGCDMGGIDLKRVFIPIDNIIGSGKYVFEIPVYPSRFTFLGFKFLKLENYSIATRLALLAVTSYGSYKLLKPSVVQEQQDDSEDEYEYSY